MNTHTISLNACASQARGGYWFPHGPKGLGRTGAVSLAVAIASFLSASLAEVDPEGNKIEVGEGWPLAQTLRLNTTITSLDLGFHLLGAVGGRALA